MARGWTARGWARAAVLASALLVGACTSSGVEAEPTVPTPTAPSSGVSTTQASGPPSGAPWPAEPSESWVRDRLAVLWVDDRPSPVGAYRRDDWPHWEDVDGNGCDGRQDTLVRWSASSVEMDTRRRCKVLAGSWVSPYDGVPASSPAAIEIDHLVPLAEAFRSGGWRWDAGERRRFANDPLELVAASSASNGSKSDSRPDEWRPARTEAWCAYADRWVAVKAAYGLTVTTSERDALGQMLETCGATSEHWPG